MEFDEADDWYTLLNQEQGMMIPNTWPEELQPVIFDGFFGTTGRLYAMVRSGARTRGVYCDLCDSVECRISAEHPAGGPYTHVSVRFEQALERWIIDELSNILSYRIAIIMISVRCTEHM